MKRKKGECKASVEISTGWKLGRSKRAIRQRERGIRRHRCLLM